MKKLEELEAKKLELMNILEIKQNEKKSKNLEINKINEELNKVNNRISGYKNFRISDHVVLRYLERVEGINIEEIKSKICTQKMIDKIVEFGDCTYRNNELDFDVIIKNNTAVTLLKD